MAWRLPSCRGCLDDAGLNVSASCFARSRLRYAISGEAVRAFCGRRWATMLCAGSGRPEPSIRGLREDMFRDANEAVRGADPLPDQLRAGALLARAAPEVARRFFLKLPRSPRRTLPPDTDGISSAPRRRRSTVR